MDKIIMKKPLIFYPKPISNSVLQLICFPYAGGGISSFIPLKQKLPEGIGLGIIELPGRGEKYFENFYSEPLKLINDLVEELQTNIQIPTIYWGHSLGANIAFELTATMKDRNMVLPQHVIVSGSVPSSFEKERKNWEKMNDDKLLHEIKEFGGTPKEIFDNKELLQILLPMLRSDLILGSKFPERKGCYTAVEASVLSGKNDTIKEIELQAWSDHFNIVNPIKWFEGGHFFINESELNVHMFILEIIGKYSQKIKNIRELNQ